MALELLYVWIENYKDTIIRQGFNLNPRYNFEFMPEKGDGNEIIGGRLSVEESHDFPEDFFPENISNVTVIVGKNGSGKSSFLESLLFLMDDGTNVSESLLTKSFFIMKSGNEIRRYGGDSLQLDNTNATITIEQVKFGGKRPRPILFDESFHCTPVYSEFGGTRGYYPRIISHKNKVYEKLKEILEKNKSVDFMKAACKAESSTELNTQ